MRNKIHSFRGILMLVVVYGLLEAPGWACVFCMASLSSSPETQGLANGFRYGIGILMVAPYLILGSIGFAIYRAYRKRIAARSAINPYSV